MELIHLKEIIVAKEGRVMERVEQTGLLMPMYACSWAAIPKQAPPNIVLQYAKQCEVCMLDYFNIAFVDIILKSPKIDVCSIKMLLGWITFPP